MSEEVLGNREQVVEEEKRKEIKKTAQKKRYVYGHTDVEIRSGVYVPAFMCSNPQQPDKMYLYIPKHENHPALVIDKETYSDVLGEGVDVYTLALDESVLTEVQAWMDEDGVIEQAREQLAVMEAGGNQLLKEILEMSIAYNNGHLEEPILDKDTGVSFYSVGRNASNEFYVGEKDGQRYVMSIGEIDQQDPSGEDMDHDAPSYKKSVKAVEKWGYLGHV